MTSYEVPNVIISELCCSCQKERHGFSSGPPSIYYPSISLIFSSYFWGNLVTDWNRQLLFLFPNADISTIHRGVGKLRNSCISLTRYENDMYLVLRALCWWLRVQRTRSTYYLLLMAMVKTHPKGIYTVPDNSLHFRWYLIVWLIYFTITRAVTERKFWKRCSCWLFGLKFLEIPGGSNEFRNPLPFSYLSFPK